jgi:hypothetical protein
VNTAATDLPLALMPGQLIVRLLIPKPIGYLVKNKCRKIAPFQAKKTPDDRFKMLCPFVAL